MEGSFMNTLCLFERTSNQIKTRFMVQAENTLVIWYNKPNNREFGGRDCPKPEARITPFDKIQFRRIIPTALQKSHKILQTSLTGSLNCIFKRSNLKFTIFSISTGI